MHLLSRLVTIVQGSWLAAVPLLFAFVFLIVPLFEIFALSVSSGPTSTGGLDGFHSQLANPAVRESLWRTWKYSCVITITVLLLAYPTAFILTTSGSKAVRGFIIFAIVAQLFVSVVVRSFGWLILLSTVQDLFGRLGLGSVSLLYNSGGAVIGMVSTLLPLMVLPVWASLRGLDMNLLSAARTLGASGPAIFRRIVWPLSVPGVFAGVIIVFASSMDGYVQPLLLGGPVSGLWASVLVVNDVIINNDVPSASALAVLYLLITAFSLILFGLVERRASGFRRINRVKKVKARADK